MKLLGGLDGIVVNELHSVTIRSDAGLGLLNVSAIFPRVTPLFEKIRHFGRFFNFLKYQEEMLQKYNGRHLYLHYYKKQA